MRMSSLDFDHHYAGSAQHDSTHERGEAWQVRIDVDAQDVFEDGAKQSTSRNQMGLEKGLERLAEHRNQCVNNGRVVLRDFELRASNASKRQRRKHESALGLERRTISAAAKLTMTSSDFFRFFRIAAFLRSLDFLTAASRGTQVAW